MPYVTTDTLKDALTAFRERGDERWAKRSEALTEEDFARVTGGLTEAEVAEVVSAGTPPTP